MSEKWLVLKFGGSSVRGPEQWQAIAERVGERRGEGFRVLVVCSAIEGMTDLLEDIARSPAEQALADRFIARHEEFADALGINGREWLGKAARRLSAHRAALDTDSSPARVAELLALGEWLSTRLGWAWLNARFATEWVDARGLLEVRDDPERSERRRWLSADCAPGADAALLAGLNGCFPVVITQGYIAAMPGGGTALLGRGGSDTSAVLLGGRVGAERVEIWTDVPGFFSADPRQLPDARLLQRLDYAEALEMAASGAGVIHARGLRAAAATSTPLWIRDTARPDLGGTLIEREAAGGDGARAVICQPGMAVILLQNIDPRQQVGFLAWVFGVIAARGISIDLVATSETTTTVAINRNANHLDEEDLADLAGELRQRCRVDLFDECVTVNIVGRGVHAALGKLGRAFGQMANKSLLMLSQSANDLCLSMLVRRGYENALLAAAHEALIGANPDARLFGPSWRDLQESAPANAVAGVQV